MEAYSSRIVHVGKAGAGQTTKMANQICIAGVVAGLSEALRFAQSAHLDMEKVYEAISGGAAQSWQMDNRWQR
jgi:3-hydroxyisobutyrate dehydrogenase